MPDLQRSYARFQGAAYRPNLEHGRRPGRILVVDDLAPNRKLLRRLLSSDGHEIIEAESGERALELARSAAPDVILLDVVLPGIDGFTTCGELKRDPNTRLVPVVLVTALRDRDNRLRGIREGADDFLTKPVDASELKARVTSLLRLKRYTDDLDSAEAVIVSLALTIEARDAALEGHCYRLATYATELGRAIGLGMDDLSALYRGGFLHDLGKIAVPDRVLLKPGRLTADEFELMKTHTVVGDRLCSELRSLASVRPIVRHHHERLDGTGYPDGLHGEAVPILAQITGVVDVFDALTTERPYKAAFPPDIALGELRGEVDRGWRSHDLVEEFAKLVHAGLGPRSVETVAERPR